MNFNPEDLPENVKKAFIEARQNPLKFAENFLVDPTLGTPFRATYPQKFILSTKKRDVWVCVHRRAGKCVVGDTLVIDPITLKPTPISKASDFTKTLCFNFDTNNVEWTDCVWIESGQKKCLKLELGSGTNLSLSTDHQVFCSKRGWVPASNIKIGDRILTTTEIPIFGDLVATTEEVEATIAESIVFSKIPDEVYLYTKESLIEYVREFFASRGRPLYQFKCIAFMLWSRDFALEFKHLLLRLGISSRIDEDGNIFIEEEVDRSLFLHTIGLDYLVTEIRSKRTWEIVTNIRNLGSRTVYDLSVEHEDHNFIGNDLVLHNSYSLTITALWHAITKPNQKIAVFAPSSTQINEFFDVIDKWIAKNQFLSALQDPTGGNHKNPQKRTFSNGSTIQGYLMGLSGSIEGAKRGITADVVICDEAQLFDEADWAVVSPIMHGDKFRSENIRCYVAGTTPDNPTNFYYEKIYKMTPAESEERVYIPITKNPEYTDAQRETIKNSTPLNVWTTEWLLELGETDAAVFRKADVERACQWDWSYGVDNINESKVRFIGVDWDKAQAGTNIAVFQYDPLTRITQVIFREEVDRGLYTYTNACNLILDLYDVFKPELVIADQGQGEMQWEYIQLEAQRRQSELSSRLIKLALQSKIEVPNPQTAELDKKMIKPFLVGLLQRKLQENLFRIPRHDEILANQLLAYRVKLITQNTTKYTTHNEHIVDCCLFCMYGIHLLYENELEQNYGAEHGNIRSFNDSDLPVQPFQEEVFWNSLEGPRLDYPGIQMPRTSLENPFGRIRTTRDFYIDDF